METHTYDTEIITAIALSSTHVLVGESGGLSAVYNATFPSFVVPNTVAVETEHGTLYLDRHDPVEVLKDVQ
jgi:hypothetical protein